MAGSPVGNSPGSFHEGKTVKFKKPQLRAHSQAWCVAGRHTWLAALAGFKILNIFSVVAI